jgi:nucleotide-binding universal stress UspA family protein
MKGWIDSAGIDCCIINQGLRYTIRTNVQNRIELQVKECDAEKALEIIDTVNEKYGPEFQEPDQLISAIKKILVPIDFSHFSLNAAKYAVNVAKQKKAELTLVHAYFNPVVNPLYYDNAYAFPSNVADALQEIEANARDGMKELREKLDKYIKEQEIEDVTVTDRLVGGIAEDAILDLAEKGQYDLIVVGAKGKAMSGQWYGSVTAKVMEKAKIPVLAVPEMSIYKDTTFKRIMYATDFDKSDGVAIRKLLNIARPLDVHIHVVHIDTTKENPFLNYDLKHFKEKFVGSTDELGMDFDMIQSKDLMEGMEKYIKEKSIDIISLTTHKRNLITALFRPSVAKELLFQIKVPLLVFHAG